MCFGEASENIKSVPKFHRILLMKNVFCSGCMLKYKLVLIAFSLKRSIINLRVTKAINYLSDRIDLFRYIYFIILTIIIYHRIQRSRQVIFPASSWWLQIQKLFLHLKVSPTIFMLGRMYRKKVVVNITIFI